MSFWIKQLANQKIQYDSLSSEDLKELSKRNMAYLSVAKKLLDPSFSIAKNIKKDVEHEIERIEAHEGFFKNELFSKDCPSVCDNRLYPPNRDYVCNQEIKGKVEYQGKIWEFQDLYKEVCIKSCYCED